MTVIESFVDITDNNHLYHPGDAFPRMGLRVSGERIAYLRSSDNLVGKPVIADESAPALDPAPESAPAPKPKRKKKNVN